MKHKQMIKNYDVIVVGSGHAGIESALASARLGHKTLILTLSLENIALLACNPSIGGTAKGHLVREIDALGGQMGISADKALLQIKMLNRGKGPAVHSLRAQADKLLYHQVMKQVLENEPNLTLEQGEVSELIVENQIIKGIKTKMGLMYGADAVIIASGVYLNSRIIIGDYVSYSGPQGSLPAVALTKSLIENDIEIRRFKTGTPARINKKSIDISKMEIQNGEDGIATFSFMSKERLVNQIPCYLTYTNEETHEIIRKNIHRSPMYNGMIEGVGPRYCPSLEDKVMRFSDKSRHQVFVEPEGRYTNEMYVQGMSSSLPIDVQIAMYRTVKGFENVQIMRFGYAIEYDCINPIELYPTMQVKKIKGLYTAGQINGSSGYEEAAAQGLMAGINASLYLKGKEPFILSRDKAYIGVLIDDLVTKESAEPYRMMTARAEYRLYLRQDNADLRLTEYGYKLGIASKERYIQTKTKKEQIENIIKTAENTLVSKKYSYIFESKGDTPLVRSITAKEAIKRTGITFNDLAEITDNFKKFNDDAIECAEIHIKYEGYLNKQEASIKEQKRLEEKNIPKDFNYMNLKGLRIEARQRLTQVRPLTLGQASRISGVSPADITVLMIYLKSIE